VTVRARGNVGAGAQRPLFAGSPRLAHVRSERVPRAVLEDILTKAGLKIGDPVSEDTAKQFRQTVAAIDEHLQVSFQSDERGGLIIAIIAP
jgi:hypothetical protein